MAPPVTLIDEAMRGRAAALARSGRHEDAAHLLAELAVGRSPTAAEHDLLARIRAQQGRFDDAERHWRAALRLDDQLTGPAAGLRRLARQRDRRGANAGGRAREGLAVALLLAVAFGGGWWLGGDDNGPAATTTMPVPAATGTPADRTTDPTTPGGADRDSDGSGGATDPAGRLRGLAARLAGPEVTAFRTGGEVVLVFREGLFATHDAPSADGRVALAAVGRRLAALPGVAVEVVGHSDGVPVRPGGRFADNTAVSLGRAVSAAGELRAAGVPAVALTVSAAGGAVAPYPDSADGDARNRTVTLRVTPPA